MLISGNVQAATEILRRGSESLPAEQRIKTLLASVEASVVQDKTRPAASDRHGKSSGIDHPRLVSAPPFNDFRREEDDKIDRILLGKIGVALLVFFLLVLATQC